MAGVSRQCEVGGGAESTITAPDFIDCASNQNLRSIRGPPLAMGTHAAFSTGRLYSLQLELARCG